MKNSWFIGTVQRVAVVLLTSSFLVSGVLNAAAPSIPEDPSKFHVFLLMGQSNMKGAASIDGQMDTVKDSRILKLNKSGFWEVAKDPITNDAHIAVGPGFQFAKTMIEENPDITIGLIPIAVGGTEISFWTKPSPKYFESVYLARKAMSDGTLKGILWHQGESDTGEEFKAFAYRVNLMTLIDDMRKDLVDPYLPFIVGGFTESQNLLNRSPLRKIVWERIKNVGTEFFRTGYVRSSGVPFIEADPIHFTSNGQREMGVRYANEFMRVDGHWNQLGKAWLDSEAIDNGDGWKYHPDLGVYYDEHWPMIKHAQLGWLKVDIDKGHVIRFDSPYIGKYRVMQEDNNEDAIYIFTENMEDPESPTYGVPYYVDLLREPGDSHVFYDHSTNTFIDRLPGMTVVEDAWDLNSLVEAEFYQTQLNAQYLRNEIASEKQYWSLMRKYVDQIVYHRNYTNYIGWEGYYYSRENETGNLRTFWMDKFLERLYYIDTYVVQGQDEFQMATDVLLMENQ